MNELLFHTSWWILGATALGGIALLLFGNRRTDKSIQRIGVAVVLAALLLGGLRFFFPTPRERMEIRTKSLVRAVDQKDWMLLKSLLDANTVLSNRNRTIAGGADIIAALTQTDCDRFGVKSASVIGIESEQIDTSVTVSVEVYSVQDATEDRPLTSSWQMDYEQSGNNWILEKITALRVGSEDLTNDDSQNYNPSGF
jgi:hypothetical protein